VAEEHFPHVRRQAHLRQLVQSDPG
jgi:hypothetical protein